MDQPSCLPRRRRVDAELVRPGVQAQLVGTEVPGDGSVDAEVALEFPDISYVVDPLLEAPDVARREAHPFDAQSSQFTRYIDVLRVGGRRCSLIDRDLYLKGALSGGSLQVTVHARNVGN